MTSVSPPPPNIRFLDRNTPPHIGTLVAITALSALGMSIFLPSLPAMTEWFGTDYATMQLSVALYLATNAVLQLAIGPLSDRFGRRPILLLGFALFIVATLGCIYAPSVEIFLAFRMVQAAIVAAIVLGRAVVRDLYGPEKSAAMIGLVTMGMSISPMLGPAVGGLLQRQFGWQASFWLLFLGGIAVMALLWADLGETAASRGKRFRDQIRDYPILFASPRFWGYNLAAGASTGCFYAYLGGGAFVGSEVYRLDPATLGLWMGAPAVGYFFGNWITSRSAIRLGIDRMVFRGSLFTLAALIVTLVVDAAGYGSPLTFFGGIALMTLGNGMVLPNATAGMLSVRPQLAGTASGLGGAMQLAGGATLSALAGAMLHPGTGAHPLLVIMTASAAVSLLAILAVMARTGRYSF